MTENPIISLSARNYKGVKQITIQPEGRTLVVVAGANGAGKSSFIDGIAEIIDPKGTRLTAKPIREGESSATAELVTKEFTAVRKWTKDDAGSLKVTSKEGATYGKGRDFLIEQTGAALLEPFAFDALKDSEQRAALLARVELPFNLNELEARYDEAYARRTSQKREVDRAAAIVASLPEVDGEAIPEETSATEILQEARSANESNAVLLGEQKRSERLATQRAALEEKLAETLAEQERVDEWLAKAHPLIDTDEIEARIENLESANREIRARRAAAVAWYNATKDHEQATAAHAATEDQIEQIRQTKADGLAKAKFPVAGLSVDADRILFEGLPFKQVNSARRIAIAFELAASAHPGLRIAIIRNGDMLDDDTLAQVEAVAQEHGYLVLVERDRGNSREIGFTVAEGEISA